MAATATQSQYRREERRTTGRQGYVTGQQPAHQTANWDDHLDGLLSDLKESLPAGRGPTSQSSAGSSLPLSADLAVPDDLPGSEDFHERKEFTSPDQRTRTVEERSRRTERIDGGSQLVSRKVVRSQSRSRTTERSTVSPEPMLSLTTDEVDRTGMKGFIERNETTTANNSTPGLQNFSSHLPAMDLPAMEVPPPVPVPGTQSHASRYEYRSSQRSASPALPRQPPPTLPRQPPPTLPKPAAPSSVTLQDATTSTTSTTEQPSGATTINYHIYNYGTEVVPPQTDSGLGTLERSVGRRWQEGSLERRVVREGSAPGPLVKSPSPSPLPSSSRSLSPSSGPLSPSSGPLSGERLYSRSVTTQVERCASGDGPGGGAVYPVQAGTLVTREHRSGGGGGVGPFPVDTVERMTRDAAGQTPVHVPSEPQDGTYPDGPRRRDLGLGQVSEVRSVQLVTEPSESASELGQTRTAQGLSQSQSMAPGVYYPPPEQINCETKFHTKEKGKEGNTKTHFEASGKYKASGGSKQKEAKDGKTIPVCLPCCAGAACVIM